jgi:16S rRNA (uracil1498-N3)-methyltransferase
VVRLDAKRAAKRVAHWQAVAAAACEQCGRNRVPPVLSLMPLASWLGEFDARATQAFLLAPRASRGVRDFARPANGITLLAGPEGGLAPEEQQAAERAGFAPVRLGPRVLRTETAAVAAIAALQALWGDF